MRLTVFVVALDVIKESAEAIIQRCIHLHPTQCGAHPISGMVGADLIVLSLQKTQDMLIDYCFRKLIVQAKNISNSENAHIALYSITWSGILAALAQQMCSAVTQFYVYITSEK